MKVKIFFSICLIIGIAMTQLYAQGNNGKGNANKTTKEFVPFDYYMPIDCDGDGVLEDFLLGELIVQWNVHQKDGIPVKINAVMHGKATSDFTTEVFKVHEIDFMVPDLDGIIYAHFNLIGNQGSHYIGAMTWDAGNAVLTVEKILCK